MESTPDGIHSIEGLRLVDGRPRYLELSERISPSALEQLLGFLKGAGQEVAFYDPCYPSTSDPGAYFSYSPDGASAGSWRMTLGNHGWTGGIYEIDEHTLCCQLFDLVSRGLLTRLRIDDVHFFSHYSVCESAASMTMNQRLREIHSRNGS